jgi:carotenoid 1,2-hydratase
MPPSTQESAAARSETNGRQGRRVENALRGELRDLSMDRPERHSQPTISVHHTMNKSSVLPRGYRWTYFDCTSDDGNHHLVVIAMIGNVFSPAYRQERLNPTGLSPYDFSTFNISLKSPVGNRFCLTEHRREHVAVSDKTFRVGKNQATFGSDRLTLDLDDMATPLPFRMRGEAVIEFQNRGAESPILLDDAGRHRWQPIASAARARIRLTEPNLSFEGTAYVDSNEGDEPLEDAFTSWQWSRTVKEGSADASIQYDCTFRDGTSRRRLFHSPHGYVEEQAHVIGALSSLGNTLFRMPRELPLEGRVTKQTTLLDAPFYSRTALRTIDQSGHEANVVHESLDLARFVNPWVQRALPYRMRAGR